MSLTAAIIQARMGSTRLPGKSIMDISGKPLVWHVVNRVKRAESIDGVILAIPEETESIHIVQAVRNLGIPILIVPGDPNDLLGRYNYAAQMFGIDTVVRVPADNPCVDPREIDRIVATYNDLVKPLDRYLLSNLDRNILDNGYPGGLGAEVYDAGFIRWLHNNVVEVELREHPHKWAVVHNRMMTIECPGKFRRPELRFDVNTIDDLEYIRSIYNGVYETKPDFHAADIIEFLDNRRLN